jgi:tetratricopeptide (TPR) repeat protein
LGRSACECGIGAISWKDVRVRAFVKSALLTGGLLLGSHPALAQTAPAVAGYPECSKSPSAQDVTAAKGAFQAGQVYFKEANYTQALVYWEDAYRRDCTAHKLLLNIATAYQLDGQLQKALNALQAYLSRVPNAPDKDQVERRRQTLQSKLDQQVAAAPPPTVETTPTEPHPTEDKFLGGRSVGALATAIAGGVVTAGGVAWVIVENGNVSDYEAICRPDPARPDNRTCPTQADADAADTAQARRTIAIVVSSVGAATLAGGLVWFFMSGDPPNEDSAALPADLSARIDSVAPVVSDDFVGLGVVGRF